MSYHFHNEKFAPRQTMNGGGTTNSYDVKQRRFMGDIPDAGPVQSENTPTEKAGIGILNLIIIGIIAYITYKVLTGSKKKHLYRKHVRQLPLPD